MVNTWRVGNNQRWAIIRFRFQHCLHQLILICSHSNLRYIYIAVGHGHHAQILLLNTLSGSREFRDCRCRSRLGRLASCVGVYFGIKYQNVNIFTGSKNMV